MNRARRRRAALLACVSAAALLLSAAPATAQVVLKRFTALVHDPELDQRRGSWGGQQR
jgi:hypothetical protein